MWSPDSCIALELAYTKAGIQHRDISMGNILIVHENGEDRGVLIDWDHSIRVDATGPPRKGRTVSIKFA